MQAATGMEGQGPMQDTSAVHAWTGGSARLRIDKESTKAGGEEGVYESHRGCPTGDIGRSGVLVPSPDSMEGVCSVTRQGWGSRARHDGSTGGRLLRYGRCWDILMLGAAMCVSASGSARSTPGRGGRRAGAIGCRPGMQLPGAHGLGANREMNPHSQQPAGASSSTNNSSSAKQAGLIIVDHGIGLQVALVLGAAVARGELQGGRGEKAGRAQEPSTPQPR